MPPVRLARNQQSEASRLLAHLMRAGHPVPAAEADADDVVWQQAGAGLLLGLGAPVQGLEPPMPSGPPALLSMSSREFAAAVAGCTVPAMEAAAATATAATAAAAAAAAATASSMDLPGEVPALLTTASHERRALVIPPGPPALLATTSHERRAFGALPSGRPVMLAPPSRERLKRELSPLAGLGGGDLEPPGKRHRTSSFELMGSAFATLQGTCVTAATPSASLVTLSGTTAATVATNGAATGAVPVVALPSAAVAPTLTLPGDTRQGEAAPKAPPAGPVLCEGGEAPLLAVSPSSPRPVAAAKAASKAVAKASSPAGGKAKEKKKKKKEFPCEECGRVLRTKFSLQRHMMTHTGAKPFECDICHARFRQSSTLQSHRYIHTGELPIACPVCPERFRHRSSYARHVRNSHPGVAPSASGRTARTGDTASAEDQ